MMNIESYYNKIERVLEMRKASKNGKAARKGLLAQSSSDPKSTVAEKKQMMAIVEIIEGIREAREEMTNDKK